MSRCFPYDPEGLERRNASFLESIKKEKELTKKEKKKEKRKEKKEKLKEVSVLSKDTKHGSKKRHHDENVQFDRKAERPPKKRLIEAEQLERSSLTEEQALPSAVFTCDSPDSTPNSSQIVKSNRTYSCNGSQGNILRIRLPVKEPEPSVQPERPFLFLQKQKEKVPEILVDQPSTSTPEFIKVLPPEPVEQPCFSGRTESVSVPEKETTGHTGNETTDINVSKRFEGSTKSRRKETKFNDLVVNWTIEPLQVESSDPLDEDWLFGSSTRQPRNETKTCDDICKQQKCLVPSRRPRACYIPEAEVYALPYCIPF